MSATILALETQVPSKNISQEFFSSAIARLLSLTPPKARLLKRIAFGSDIQKRHVSVPNFLDEDFPKKTDAELLLPKTAQRNEMYKRGAPKLAEEVSHKVIKQWSRDRSAITHVISVSCTGMIAPGIEFLLIDRLNLSPTVERLGINFMGCFGAFKGLAIANALAMESPNHRILLVCTELCSLHFQEDLNVDTMVANSIFADGAAAVIIGAKPQLEETPLFEIHNRASVALKNTLELMTWEAGDHGYRMRLSAAVPDHLEKHIAPFARRLLGAKHPFDQCTWAIHPGGKAILEAITRACALQREQLSASWKVLQEYGNMSSPTFLFVLKEILNTTCSREWVAGLGFGPGLSVEGLLLKRVDPHVAE